MKKVHIEFKDGFTPEQERLRRSGWGEELQHLSSEDKYDAASYNVQAVIDGEVVGMIRITDGAPYVFNEWAVEPCPLPMHEHVVSLSRAVVRAEWRKFSLYKVMLIEALIHLAEKKNPRTVVSAVEPDFPLLPYLLEVGIEIVGDPIDFVDPPHPARAGYCIMTKPSEHLDHYRSEKRKLESYLEKNDLEAVY